MRWWLRSVNPHEPLGPSSRKTGIVISEIMWKPAPRTDGNNVEFLELTIPIHFSRTSAAIR